MQSYMESCASQLQSENQIDIETAAQNAVLHEQEIATQEIIQSQREAGSRNGTSEDRIDIFSGRHDPNAIKEHLLKITNEHRTQMALKRGQSTFAEEECRHFILRKVLLFAVGSRTCASNSAGQGGKRKVTEKL